MENAGQSEKAGEPVEGIVVKTQSGFFTVDTPVGRVVCGLRGALKLASKKTELCVLGDRVEVEEISDGRGTIRRVLPRERVLSRVEPSGYAGTSTEREQVLLANLDQAAFVSSAAHPVPNTRFLDRCLVAAEKAEVPSIVLVLNKIDLVGETDARKLFEVYERIGYTVLYASAEAKLGIETLRAQLTGRLSVFTGPSGVGKSSLLNAIQPGLGQAVGAVSRRLSKGRHTTVNSEMFALEGGGYVADTPGIRGLAPWDVEPSELDGYFREFTPFVARCQFNDCTHMTEPGCAVRQAVAAGQISPARYDSYGRLRAELEAQYVY
jgi:ribosome biogenesis GTPase